MILSTSFPSFVYIASSRCSGLSVSLDVARLFPLTATGLYISGELGVSPVRHIFISKLPRDAGSSSSKTIFWHEDKPRHVMAIYMRCRQDMVLRISLTECPDICFYRLAAEVLPSLKKGMSIMTHPLCLSLNRQVALTGKQPLHILFNCCFCSLWQTPMRRLMTQDPGCLHLHPGMCRTNCS